MKEVYMKKGKDTVKITKKKKDEPYRILNEVIRNETNTAKKINNNF